MTNIDMGPSGSRPRDGGNGPGAGPGPSGPASGGGGPFAAIRNAARAFGSPGGKLLAIAPAVLTLVIGVAIGSAAGGSSPSGGASGGPQAAPTVRVTVTATPTSPTASADATGSSSPGAAASGAAAVPAEPASGPAGVGTVSLVNLTPVSGAFQSSDTSPVLNGKPQLLAIAQDMDYNNTSGDAGYNLGRHYTRFTALLGLDDNSANSKLTPTVEIDGDGLKLATYTPTLGHPVKINLNVAGVLRMDIKWSDPGANTSGNPVGTLVIGDGQLNTVPGYHPSPSASPPS